jgi:hypothetical protein
LASVRIRKKAMPITRTMTRILPMESVPIMRPR